MQQVATSGFVVSSAQCSTPTLIISAVSSSNNGFFPPPPRVSSPPLFLSGLEATEEVGDASALLSAWASKSMRGTFDEEKEEGLHSTGPSNFSLLDGVLHLDEALLIDGDVSGNDSLILAGEATFSGPPSTISTQPRSMK